MNTSYKVGANRWKEVGIARCYSFLITLLLAVAFTNVAYAQQVITVTGQVTDENNEPLPGTTVAIEGTDQGTIADLDGGYSIDVAEEGVLVFSFVGFETQSISVDGRETIDVVMVEAQSFLDELVVVGYGVQEKATMTGSVGTIAANEIENRTVSSAEELLQGQVAGLNVIRNSGQPGNQSINLQIRGTSTFSGNPVLVLVDGVPTSLDRVNPNDIESISVLKDAASASIYGSRASGGVILVTTKTGQKGEPQFSFRSTVSRQSPTRFPTKVSALDHMLAQNEMRENDGGPPKYSQEEIDEASSPGFKEWDWDDFMYDDALQTNQNFSVSGGTDRHDYYASIGYLYQDGIFLNSDYQRFNVQLNQNLRLGDRLKIGLNAAYSPAVRTAPASVNFGLIAQTSSLIGIRTDDGKWLTHPERTGGGRNPLYAASEDGGQELNKSSRITGNLKVDYDILPNLMLTGSYGLVQNSARNRNYTALLTFYDQYNPDQVASTTDYNTLDIDYRSSIQQNTNLLLNYTNNFRNHSLDVLAGVTAEWYLVEADGIHTRDFLTDNLYTINAGSSDPALWGISGTANEWALASGISRVKYAYQDKYLLEGSVRYDGSSRFTEDLRWGLFPAFSAGWVITEESFLSDSDIFTYLKLRGSWGQVGNQNAVGYYPFASTLSQSAVYFGGSPYRAVRTAGTPNPLLTWESKESLNLGIEGSLFKNILEYELDVFKERTDDILLVLPVPTTFGQSAPVQNAGVVENRGWEVKLHHRNNIGDFGYGVSLQISDAKNKVIDMAGISPIISGATITESSGPVASF